MSNNTGTVNVDDMSDIFTGTANSFAFSGVKAVGTGGYKSMTQTPLRHENKGNEYGSNIELSPCLNVNNH